jgi:hypothetical protein
MILSKKNAAIIIILLFALWAVIMGGQLSQQRALREDTFDYLEEEGYDIESDISEHFVSNSGGRSDFYTIYITFEEEPEVTYLYTYQEDSDDIFLLNTIGTPRN